MLGLRATGGDYWRENVPVTSSRSEATTDEIATEAGCRRRSVNGSLVSPVLSSPDSDIHVVISCPVILGQGARLFPDAGPDVALDLVESRSTPKGITIQVYRPNGRLRYARADS